MFYVHNLSLIHISSTVSSLGSQKANYIRNSVKATVDAYDGSVDLYVWDQSDPVIKAWEKIFPGQYHQLDVYKRQERVAEVRRLYQPDFPLPTFAEIRRVVQDEWDEDMGKIDPREDNPTAGEIEEETERCV